MSNLRRIPCVGHPYFITNVTDKRSPFLIDNIDTVWDAVNSAKARRPFELIAWVVLPEHFHFLFDTKGNNISDIMNRLKMSFSMGFRKRHSLSGPVWQKRFWDHVIRDQQDFNRHLDYIHINPVKHGLVKRAYDWPHSSIHKFKDFYPEDWGMKDEVVEGEFGE